MNDLAASSHSSRVRGHGLPPEDQIARLSAHPHAPLQVMDAAEEMRRAERHAAAERRRACGQALGDEAIYHWLFDAMDEGFCLIEVLFQKGVVHDLRFLEANPAFEKLSGLAGAIGRTLRELDPAEADGQSLQLFGQVASTGTALRFEHHARGRDGIYDVRAFRVGEAESRRVAVLFNDITARKRREANLAFLAEITADISSLSAAEEIMQAVGMRLGAFLRVHACNFVDVNEARDELRLAHGWNADPAAAVREPLRITDFLGEEFRRAGRAGQTLVVNDAVHDARMDSAAYATLQIGAFVIVPFHQKGMWQHFLAITDACPREWRADEVELFQEVAGRVFPRLERARVEQALRESEERNRIVLSAAGMASWDYDVASDRIAWNEQHYRILGLAPDQQEKKAADFLAFVHPEDLPDVVAALRRAVEETGIYEAEFRIVRADGAVRWMSGFGKAIETKGRHALRMAGIMHDVTERHEAEEALAAALQRTRAAQAQAEAASRAKDRFLAVLSHELRTPLTPSLMAAHMLMDDPGLSADARESVAMIHRNIALEAKLVDDLLDVTRIARGALKLQWAPVDAHEVIQHAVAICQPDLDARQHRLTLSLDAARHTLCGDSARLQQVVWNLLKNACKFTPSGGRIEVQTSNDADCLLLRVADSGIGLEADALVRIFDSFTQADDDIMRKFGGLGLGLAISKAVAEAHGGRIWAESAGRGQGAAFVVLLPLGGPAEASAQS